MSKRKKKINKKHALVQFNSHPQDNLLAYILLLEKVDRRVNPHLYKIQAEDTSQNKGRNFIRKCNKNDDGEK